MKVVTPYRPFAPEALSHERLGPFDWVGAIEMLRESVAHACVCRTVTITDVDTIVPGDVYVYATAHRRLMPWLIEVCLRYLESDDFDQDTAMLSPDMLVYAPLERWFCGDLAMVARLSVKFRGSGRMLLFGAQFWRHSGKARLVALYRRALRIAETLPEEAQRWGADIEPFLQLLAPLSYGVNRRAGLDLSLIGEKDLMISVTADDITKMERGERLRVKAPIVDFRYMRKLHMRQYFDATIGATA